MRTIERSSPFKALLAAAALAGLTAIGAPGARAGIEPSPFRPWVGLSLASGGCYAGQEAFRSLYGAVHAPIHAQADLYITRMLMLSAGFRIIRAEGSTRVVGPGFADETYALTFRMSSLRAGPGLRLPLRRFALRAGLGLSFNSIRERWVDFPLDSAFKSAGFFCNLGAGYEIGRRWEIFGRLEFASVPTDEGAALEPEVNLGGFEAVLGLMFKL